MGSKRDYYEVLGVKKDADESEIKSAYKKMALRFHPDRQYGKSDAEKKNAEEMFKACSEAYEVLSDKDKRAQYDQFGFDGPQMQGGFGGFDMGDFMRRHGGMFGSMFGSMFGGMDDGFFGGMRSSQHDGPPQPGGPEDGRDVQTQISISFKESVFGCEKKFDLDLGKECGACHGTGVRSGSKPVKCPKCGGSGQVVHTERRGFMVSQTISACPDCRGTGWKYDECPECHGTKRVKGKRHICVKVPAGAQTGMRLRLAGSGHCGVAGGSNGDLFIIVNAGESGLFERDGNNIAVAVHVSPVRASLGGQIDVPTLYGWRKLTVQPGVKPGSVMKIAGAGVKAQNGTGDMYVTILVEPYSDLLPEQTDLLNRLEATEKPSNLKCASETRAAAESFYSE